MKAQELTRVEELSLSAEQKDRVREIVQALHLSQPGMRVSVEGIANMVRSQPNRLTPRHSPEKPQPPRPKFLYQAS
jgi:hypothetical protein